MPSDKHKDKQEKGSKKPIKSRSSIPTSTSSHEDSAGEETAGAHQKESEPSIIVNVLEPESKNETAIEANRIAAESVKVFKRSTNINFCLFWITLGLAVVAILQAKYSKNAYTIAQKTFEETKKYDSINLYNSNIQSIKEDSMENSKFKRDMLAFNLQQEALKTQIASLNETQKEFEIENKAYIQMKDFHLVQLPNDHFGIEYIIANLGNQPAKIVNQFTKAFIDTRDFTTLDEFKEVYKDFGATEGENIYVIKESPQTKTHVFNKVFDTTEVKKIKTGYYNFFAYGKLKFINLVSNKRKIYEYAVEISGKSPTLYKMIYNENYDIP